MLNMKRHKRAKTITALKVLSQSFKAFKQLKEIYQLLDNSLSENLQRNRNYSKRDPSVASAAVEYEITPTKLSVNSENLQKNRKYSKSVSSAASSLIEYEITPVKPCAAPTLEENVKKAQNNNYNTKRSRCCSVRAENRDKYTKGFFVVSFLKAKYLDDDTFFSYTCMKRGTYEQLLQLIVPHIHKKSCREPLPADMRLALTLMHFAQGTEINEIARTFKVGKETARSVVLEIADVICPVVGDMHLSEPESEQYAEIALNFWQKFQMPNCVSVTTHRHIACYKSNYHIQLLTSCDANYCFTHADIGDYGTTQCTNIFNKSDFGCRLLNNKLPLPPATALPGTNIEQSYYFLGDNSVPFATHLMQPYAEQDATDEEQNFNLLIMRAQNAIENTLGVLTARWQILQKSLRLRPINASKLVLACLALHNFIMKNEISASVYCPVEYTDWEDEQGLLHMGAWREFENQTLFKKVRCGNRANDPKASLIRNTLCTFVNSFVSE